MRNQKGQAAILIIFVIGMVSVLIGISLVKTGFGESIMGRNTSASTNAFYAANSGVEEAFYRLGHGSTNPGSFIVPVGVGSSAQVNISGLGDQKTIESVGTYKNFVRKIKVVTENTSLKPGFTRAIHAGAGGFEIENNAIVNGDVYANGDIMGGSSNKNCTGNPAMINGIAISSATFTTLPDGSGNGVCVSSDAYAQEFNSCFVKGTAYYVESPVDCSNNPPNVDISGEIPSPVASIPFPINDQQIDDVTKYITQTYPGGDCYVGGPSDTPSCYTKDATNTPILGDIIINGSLTISSSSIKFSGPIWVKQDMIFASNVTIRLTPDLTEVSQMIVVDGRIIAKANIDFFPNLAPGGNKVYLLPISRYDPRKTLGFTGDICDKDNTNTTIDSINVQGNINDVLFYAPHGCLYIKGVGGGTYFGSAIAEKILLGGGTLTYDTALVKAVFGLTKSGGWLTVSFKEE